MRPILLAIVAAVATTAVQAEEHVSKCCGIVSLTVYPDGLLVGRYQRPNGRLIGRMDGEGVVRGFWFQRKGFKNCTTGYNGSQHWGRFEFGNIGTAQITGTWGDCEAEPAFPWGFQNDPVVRDLDPLS